MLRAEPELARQTYQALVEANHAGRLLMGDRLLCSVLRPRFITQSGVDELARVSRILADVFERAGDRLLASSGSLDLIGASDEERAIWELDPGYPGFTLTSRLDSFMVGEEPRFVEYNAESPAGIGFCDCLADVFETLPGMRRWESEHEVRRFYGRQALYETLLWAYRAWGGRDTPTIAVVDWEDVLTRRDFELCAEVFEQRGLRTFITDPRRLDYRAGRLRLGNETITLVYRRVLLHELLDKSSEVGPLLQAYRDGAVCMVNSPRSKLLHKKAVLALLSEGRLGLELTAEEQATIEATIPWTRLVAMGESTHDGVRVELVRFVLAEQPRLVLKPSDDYGGRGVVLGWEVSPGEWERALEVALSQPYVVQERVPVPQAEFPTWDDNHLELAPFLLDTDPLLFRGELGSLLTRISGSALLNVSAGAGSTTPTFMIEEA